jgi:hypothetical protein
LAEEILQKQRKSKKEFLKVLRKFNSEKSEEGQFLYFGSKVYSSC